jgi:6-phosphogluconate dehydrogenase, C-terminal domain
MKPHALPTSIVGIALIVLSLAPRANPTFAKSQVGDRLRDVQALAAGANGLPVLADFDGDDRLDQAELNLADEHRCIRVRFGDSRESDLELEPTLQTFGTILVRDVNRDNKPDLIWLPHFQSIPVAIWLGDGLGHFTESINRVDDETDVRSLLPGNTDPRTVDGSNDEEHAYVAPDSVSSELPRAANLEYEAGKPLGTAGSNRRRDLGLYLSYLYTLWSDSEVNSTLLGIIARATPDNNGGIPGTLFELIGDEATTNGSGRWASLEARDLNVSTPTIDILKRRRAIVCRTRHTCTRLHREPRLLRRSSRIRLE